MTHFLQNNPTKDMQRSDFFQHVTQGCESGSVVRITGEWSDQMYTPEGKIAVHRALENALVQVDENNDIVGNDIIIKYDPTTGKLSFPEKHKIVMRERFMNLISSNQIQVSTGVAPTQGQMSPLESLMTPSVLGAGAYAPNDVFFNLLNQLITVKKDTPLCVVIENVHSLLPQEHDSRTDTPNSYYNPDRLSTLFGRIDEDSKMRLILCDKDGRLGKYRDIVSQVTTREIPSNGTHDIRTICRASTQLILDDSEIGRRILKLGVGLSTFALVRIFGSGTQEEMLEELLKIKKQEIEQELGGLADVYGSWEDVSEVYLSPNAQEYWEGQAEEFRRDPKLVAHNGCILVGPTGTGKTEFIRKLTQMCDTICVCVKNLSTEGLSGKSTDKLEKIMRVMKKHGGILYFDEFHLMVPRNNGGAHHSGSDNNDRSLLAVMQTELAEITKSGKVWVLASTNYIDQIDTVARRNGRLGKLVSFGPPKNSEEKYGIFDTIWRRTDTVNIRLPNKKVVSAILDRLPHYAVGTDINAIICNSLQKFRRGSNKQDFFTIFTQEVLSFQKLPDFVKEFDRQCEAARAAHLSSNSYPLDEVSDTEATQSLSLEDAKSLAAREIIREAEEACRKLDAKIGELRRAEDESLQRQLDLMAENEQKMAIARDALAGQSEEIRNSMEKLQIAHSIFSLEKAASQFEFETREAEFTEKIAVMNETIAQEVFELTGEKIADIEKREKQIMTLQNELETMKGVIEIGKSDIGQLMEKLQILVDLISTIASGKLSEDQKTRLAEAQAEAERIQQMAEEKRREVIQKTSFNVGNQVEGIEAFANDVSAFLMEHREAPEYTLPQYIDKVFQLGRRIIQISSITNKGGKVVIDFQCRVPAFSIYPYDGEYDNLTKAGFSPVQPGQTYTYFTITDVNLDTLAAKVQRIGTIYSATEPFVKKREGVPLYDQNSFSVCYWSEKLNFGSNISHMPNPAQPSRFSGLVQDMYKKMGFLTTYRKFQEGRVTLQAIGWSGIDYYTLLGVDTAEKLCTFLSAQPRFLGKSEALHHRDMTGIKCPYIIYNKQLYPPSSVSSQYWNTHTHTLCPSSYLCALSVEKELAIICTNLYNLVTKKYLCNPSQKTLEYNGVLFRFYHVNDQAWMIYPDLDQKIPEGIDLKIMLDEIEQDIGKANRWM